jgi:hypothetical protein
VRNAAITPGRSSTWKAAIVCDGGVASTRWISGKIVPFPALMKIPVDTSALTLRPSFS